MPSFRASIVPGLEPAVQRELAQWSIIGQPDKGGVEFSCDWQTIVTAAPYLTTIASLNLQLVREREFVRLSELRIALDSLELRKYWPAGTSIELNVSTRRSRLSRGDIISDKARRILKAILESDAGQSAAIFRINIRVSENKLWISTPLHSTLLHRRGWRQENVRTPLRENWAAALLTVAGWEPNEPLVDPFCGSGTILIEAGRKAAGLPAHVEAPFGWSPWYENSHSPFQSSTQQRSAIFGSDKHELSVQKAHINATTAQADVHLRVADIRQLTPPPTAPGLVLTNPPYGVHSGKNTLSVYRSFGQRLQQFSGWRVLFLAKSRDQAKAVSSQAQQLTHFSNGGIRVGVWVVDEIT